MERGGSANLQRIRPGGRAGGRVGGRAGGRGRTTQRQSSANIEVVVHTREKNWSVVETTQFLGAVRHVQIALQRSDLKFIATEWNTIFEEFLRTTPQNQRGIDSLRNRLKTLRSEYINFKSLLSRSGWAWDSVNHRVVAPNQEDWDALFAQNRMKWRYYPKKKFPWLRAFAELLGNSAITGDWGAATEYSTNSGSGSSQPELAEYDEVPIDSEERGQFDFQEMRHQVAEETIEGGRVDEPATEVQPSTELGGTTNRSGSSNKRKRGEAPEGSRSNRAKKSITDSQARDEEDRSAMGHLVKAAEDLVKQNHEYLAIQHEKVELNRKQMSKQISPQEIVDVLKSYGLNNAQRRKVMHALKDPVDQHCFIYATADEQGNNW